MPIYEYECRSCSGEFELLVLSHDAAEVSCPHCESLKVQRLASITHYRHADHWMFNVQNGLKKSLEKDQIKAEMKKTVAAMGN